mmetsp:Transcript_24998/g.75326  ORF Transcript_24998/g.75326 Transcript_24998/m.75326 type:complete len:284 (-) Transcript_24998:6617-7468(-)
MVQQLTKDGNDRSELRSKSPIGDIVSTICRYSRTRSTKRANSSPCEPSVFLCRGRVLSTDRIFSQMSMYSSIGKTFGTCPEFKMLPISSRYAISLIWVSAKRKTKCSPFSPAIRITFFKSSRHSSILYVFVISIWKRSKSLTYAASRVKDCRPEPPTPTKRQCDRGCRITREMRQMCSMAKRKRTRSIRFFETLLYSSKKSSATCWTLRSFGSSTWRYIFVSAFGFSKSQKIKDRIVLSVTSPLPSMSRSMKRSLNESSNFSCTVFSTWPKNQDRSASSTRRS